MSDFKKLNSFEDRCSQSKHIRDKYPNRIPIIVARNAHHAANIPEITRQKYLVPSDLSFAQFMHVIRTRIKLPAEVGLYLFVADTVMVPASSTMSVVDSEHRDADGFLYVTLCGESTFGGM